MSDVDSAAWMVREGQDVLSSDGKKIGEVTGSAGSALIVKHGFLFTAKELYVPVSAIAAIDPEAVHLNVTADVATSDDWTQLPEGAAVVPNADPGATDSGSSTGAGTTSSSGDAWQITEGMAVIGADGARIGEVEDGTEESITVRIGRFFSKTIVLSASQIADVRGDAVHVTATKADLGQGAISDTPLADLQGQITNAWSGTKADLDAGVPAVDYGQPDPDLPIAPPPGDTPYTPPVPVSASVLTHVTPEAEDAAAADTPVTRDTDTVILDTQHDRAVDVDVDADTVTADALVAPAADTISLGAPEGEPADAVDHDGWTPPADDTIAVAAPLAYAADADIDDALLASASDADIDDAPVAYAAEADIVDAPLAFAPDTVADDALAASAADTVTSTTPDSSASRVAATGVRYVINQPEDDPSAASEEAVPLDAPDETIDSAALAGEVPGLDLSDASIPAASEGGIALFADETTEPASTEPSDRLAFGDDVSALSDADAIGESPDAGLADEAAAFSASGDYAEYADTGYTDLPSDPFEGDGDEPEDVVAVDVSIDDADADDGGSIADAPPVDLPGDLAVDEQVLAAVDAPEDAPGFTQVDADSALSTPIEEMPAAPEAPAFAAATFSATAPEPESASEPETPAIATPAASASERTATVAPSNPEPEKEGLFGQLRRSIASFFDKEETTTPPPAPNAGPATSTVAATTAGAAALTSREPEVAPEPVDIDATAPDVEVGATIPDASAATDAAWDTGNEVTDPTALRAESWETESDAPKGEREGVLEGARQRIDQLLDNPAYATRDDADTTAGIAAGDGDAVNVPVTDLPDADLHASQDAGEDKGFFHEMKERFDTFLDNPDEAQKADTTSPALPEPGSVLSDEESTSVHAEDADALSADASPVRAEDVLSPDEWASVSAEDAVVTDVDEVAADDGEVTDAELVSAYGEDAPLAVDVDPDFLAETGADADATTESSTLDDVAFEDEPEEIAADDYAQELYVSDPDINGVVHAIDAEAVSDDETVDEDVNQSPESGATIAAAATTFAAAPVRDDRPASGEASDSEFTPEVEEHPTLDERTELAPDVAVPHADDEQHEGFFESLRDKVEHFLDNPDEAEGANRVTASTDTAANVDSEAPLPAEDAAFAVEAEGWTSASESTGIDATGQEGVAAEADDASTTASGMVAWEEDAGDLTASAGVDADTFAAPADSSAALASRFTVVSADDDDLDDFFDSLPDDAGNGSLTAPELFTSEVEPERDVAGASDAFTQLAEPEQIAELDVEVDEAAAVPLVPTSELASEDEATEDGEQAESDLFAAVVDATAESDIDAFGTADEHHPEADADDSTEAGIADSAEKGDDHDERPASFSPRGDAEVLAELPPVDDDLDGDDLTADQTDEPASAIVSDDSSAESALIEAEEIVDAPDGPGDAGDLDLTDPDLDGTLDAGDEIIGRNAQTGTLADAGQAATDWVQGEARSISSDAPFTPTPLAGDTTVGENAQSGTLANAAEIVTRQTSPDSTIAENARRGTLAGGNDLAREWVRGDTNTGGDAEPPKPTPLSGDAGVAENARSGSLAGADEIVEEATSQDRTIAENARTGSLSGASDLARAWTSGEAASTADNAQAMAEGKTPTIAGAVPLSARTEPASEEDQDTASDEDGQMASLLHGPAETEGIDWVAAVAGQDEPNGWLVKGNANSGIYHTPESPSYAATEAEVWFPTAEAAERAGYRAPRNLHHAGASVASAARHAADAAASGQELDDEAEIGSNDSSSGGESGFRASTLSATTGADGDTGDGESADEEEVLFGPADSEGIDWVAALEGGEAPNGWTVKGNANSGIYHTPESPSYEQTIAEAWFPDAAAAERAGYRAPRFMGRHGGGTGA